MFKNYCKMAWRSLVKNRLSSLINLFGLATGMAVVLIIFFTIQTNLSYNRFHEHFEDIYTVMKTQHGTEVTTGGVVPGQLGPWAKKTLPGVEAAARGAFEQPQLSYGGKSFNMVMLYTDPEFFRIFTFPSAAGSPLPGMQQTNTIVLTASAAARLFGQENPIGKTVIQNANHPLQVVAVIRDVPDNSMYQFEGVIPFSFYELENPWLNKWDDNRVLTWLQLRPNASLATINQRLTALLQEKTNDPKSEVFAYSLKDAWLHNSFRNGHPDGGRVQGVILLALVGAFVLLIACANFVNLSTARSERRFREAGVRKTLGASRAQLMMQFFAETLLLTVVAMTLGMALCKWIAPYFNNLTQSHLKFDLFNLRTLAALAGLTLITALCAGAYPAIFMSRPRPAAILKGISPVRTRRFNLRKILVGVQFMLTILMIIVTLVVIRQEEYARSRPIGYDQQNLIDIPAQGDLAKQFSLLRNELTRIPGVTSVSAGTDDLVHFGAGTDGISWPGKTADQDFYVKVSSVKYNWIKTAGLQLVEGRDFSPAYGADSAACLITETAVRKMKLKAPVLGTKLGGNIVIGVVKDFTFNDAFNQPEPLVFYLANGPVNHFFVRINNDIQWRETVAGIERAIKSITADFPFEYHFVASEYQKQFQGIQTTVTLLNAVGLLTIIISCLGLFGLSVYVAERRVKEIGIRKVLGAEVMQLWLLLSRDFLQPVVIAFMVAVPLSILGIRAALSHVAYRAPVSWDIFVMAGGIVMLIAVGTVSIQAFRSAGANPVHALRSE